MKIKLTSIFVNDQNKAFDFYTKILGFAKKADVSAGKYRWLTVVSQEEPNGSQLVLEPNDNPVSRSYQEAIYKQGIPATMFFVDDIQKEYRRRSEEHTSELQSRSDLVCRLLLEKKKWLSCEPPAAEPP